MLSLSKHERTLRLSSPYPSTSSGRTDWKGVLRQASFDRLRTEQGERTGKASCDTLPSSGFLRQAQDGAGRTD
ncbi:MAG: hypothetical protein LBD67_00195 [Candidatus Accumulibacter sp.]|nr:hypothetical protein [Accumulibacter sp.]